MAEIGIVALGCRTPFLAFDVNAEISQMTASKALGLGAPVLVQDGVAVKCDGVPITRISSWREECDTDLLRVADEILNWSTCRFKQLLVIAASPDLQQIVRYLEHKFQELRIDTEVLVCPEHEQLFIDGQLLIGNINPEQRKIQERFLRRTTLLGNVPWCLWMTIMLVLLWAANRRKATAQ